MSEGSKYELYIPHELAYGPSGSGGAIAPYSTLIFTVELVAVK
jgi:FKBP-type peptidyl-prolyl cis-trans isomerase FklB